MIAIVTDTTCDLPPDLIQQYRIEVVPLYVHFGEGVFQPGVNLTNEQFLDRLKNAPTLPTTDPASVDDFMAVYRRLLDKHESIVSIHISSLSSQTYNNALAASKQVGNANIHVIDSLSVSGGLGLIVLAAARLVEGGAPVEAIVKRVEAIRARLCFYLTVDTIEYLHKGGRVGGAKAWAGMLLGLKPVLTMQNGQVEPVTTAPTRARALARLRSMVIDGLADYPGAQLAVFHVAAYEEARRLADDLAAVVKPTYLLFCEVGPVVATHTGPGTLAVAFYSDTLHSDTL
jgi:DegV family protein with EDD domain